MAVQVNRSTFTKFLTLTSFVLLIVAVVSAKCIDDDDDSDRKLDDGDRKSDDSDRKSDDSDIETADSVIIDPEEPLQLPVPCTLITCRPDFFCQVVRARECNGRERICAECVPCPTFQCPMNCFPSILRNGCPGRPCLCRQLPVEPPIFQK